MALKPTIYKIELSLSDMDRHIYETVKLTVDQHPSETLQRMMVRVLVYGLNYHPDLSFTKGLSAQEEPELWQCAPDGSIQHWIELGQVSADRVRKGVSRAERLSLYAYGSEVDVWWPKTSAQLMELPKLSVYSFDWAQVSQLDRFVERTMSLTLSISDDELYLAGGDAEPLSLTVDVLHQN